MINDSQNANSNNINLEKEEEELYQIISKSLMEVCEEKPSDPIYFLSSKMLELVNIDINSLDLKLYHRQNNKDKLMLTTLDKLKNGKSFLDTYNILHPLGNGSLGSVYLIEKKADPTFKYAAKIIEKKDSSGIVISETLKHTLSSMDHRNLVKIIEIEEDDSNIYFVNEYCPFGNLYEYIQNNAKHITEEIVIDICKQIYAGLSHLHELKIVHEELKPENILIYNSESNEDEGIKSNLNVIDFKSERFNKKIPEIKGRVQIKIADFGSSSLVLSNSKNNNFKEFTPETLNLIAPEAITTNYTYQSDIYSAGVIMYFLFSGKFPFDIKKPKSEILFDILNRNIDLSVIRNELVKDFLINVFEKNPLDRKDAQTCLEHELFNPDETSTDEKDQLQLMEVFSQVSNFVVGKNLRQIVLNYMCSNKLFKEKSFQMSRLFEEADINKDGALDVDELIKKYSKFFPGTTETQKIRIKELVDNLDINKNGKIDYSEFMLISSQLEKESSESVLKEVFDYFDENRNGYIEIKDLIKILKDENLEYDRFQEMINEFDQNNDGVISFEEFLSLINKYN